MVWKKLVPRRPSSEVVLRVVADAVLVNAALALSFMGRFLTFFLLREEELISNRTYMGLFSESLMGIEHSAGLLTVIAVAASRPSAISTNPKPRERPVEAQIGVHHLVAVGSVHMTDAICLGKPHA